MTKPRVSAGLWAVLLLAISMPFWDLGHPLWEVDDARYAEVPREMVERGDWLTPSLNYIEYLQKPPLIYWLDAVSYSTFGVSEASSRLPLALLAILGLAGIAWLGAWLFSPFVGLIAAAMLSTSLEFSILSHLQTPDMAVSVFLLWAAALALRVLKRPEDSWWAAPACGAAAGLAFLSKGLVGFVFPGAWAVLLAALFPETRRGFRKLCLSAAIPVAVAMVVPWFWAMTSRHPGFLYHFFIEHHFKRFLTPEFNRPGPWYYYIGVDFGGLLPWAPLAVAACALPLARWKESDVSTRQLALWVAFVFCFFSVSKSKLPTYILPVLPFQCLLAAEFIARERGEDSAVRRWTAWCSGGLGAVLALAVPAYYLAWPKWAPRLLMPESLRWSGAAALAALGGILLLQARVLVSQTPRFGRRFPVLATGAALLTALFLVGARQADGFISAKSISAEILALEKPGDRLMTYDFYLQGIPFYTHRPVDVLINFWAEFIVAKNDPRYPDRFGTDTTIRELANPGRKNGAIVVVRKRLAEQFLGLAPRAVKNTFPFPNALLVVF